MKRIFVVLAAMTIGACASGAPEIKPLRQSAGWIASNNVDEFTDKKTCKITWADKAGIYPTQRVLGLYPVIEIAPDGSKKVGVESVALQTLMKITVPVGDVQWRVDDLPARDIKAMDQAAIQARVAAGDQAGAIQAMTAGMMSPSTMATGSDADAMLAELLAGSRIRIRQVVPGNVGDTGEFPTHGIAEAVAICEGQ